MFEYSFPTHLKHQPVAGVDGYEAVDGKYATDSDAKGITIGFSQWNHSDLSLKVWRRDDEKWSRQSEELPLHRAIDLTSLLVSVLGEGLTEDTMKYPEGIAKRVVVDSDDNIEKRALKRAREDFLAKLEVEKKALQPRLLALKEQLDAYLASN